MNRLDPGGPPPELDPQKVDAFGRRLLAGAHRRIRGEQLWAAFARAFPERPHGADERRLLVAACTALAERGILRLPVSSGRGWDGSLVVPVPRFVDLCGTESAPRRRTWKQFPWHPRLQWIADLERLDDAERAFLFRVQEGLVAGAFARGAPLKYRSLQLTGDEKRLAALARGRLFAAGRLTWDLLGCLEEAPPIAWAEVGPRPRAIVFENAGPFAVAREALARHPDPPYGVVAYGGGAVVVRSIVSLGRIGRALERIDYVGDLDRPGLRIACAAGAAARVAGLPSRAPAPGIRAAPALHAAMLRAAAAFGYPNGWPSAGARRCALPEDSGSVEFLPASVRSAVLRVLAAGCRIPEEVLGPDELETAWRSPWPDEL